MRYDELSPGRVADAIPIDVWASGSSPIRCDEFARAQRLDTTRNDRILTMLNDLVRRCADAWRCDQHVCTSLVSWAHGLGLGPVLGPSRGEIRAPKSRLWAPKARFGRRNLDLGGHNTYLSFLNLDLGAEM